MQPAILAVVYDWDEIYQHLTMDMISCAMDPRMDLPTQSES